MNKKVIQKIDKYDIQYCKRWLCDKTPIKVKKGLSFIATISGLFGPPHKEQIANLDSKLLMDIMSAERLLRRVPEPSYTTDDGGILTISDGIVTIDDIVTLESCYLWPDISYNHIRSRPQFVKLIYQYMSYFPVALSKAYTEVTGENLILDDLSVVRKFYEKCFTFDSWTSHQLCAIISHCDPEVLDYISQNPKDKRSVKYTDIFSRSDLYEQNLPAVKAALHGGGFEFIHFDRDNWERTSLKPKKGLEWAKKKGIHYHPVLDELMLASDEKPEIFSGYTTPYLEMMQEVIRELEISKEKQGKKEAIAALFEKKLAAHNATPSSQKLADAMATLVRLPESQQGRAKRKG